MPSKSRFRDILAPSILYSTVAVIISNAALFVSNWAVIHWFGNGFHGALVWLVGSVQLALLASGLGLAGKAGIANIAHQRATGHANLDVTVSTTVVVPLIAAGLVGLVIMMFSDSLAAMRPGIDAAAVRFTGAWVVR